LRVILTFALAATCAAYFLAEKTVTLADEGSSRSVTTYASTVTAALTRLGVEVGPADRVMPDGTAVLAAQKTIEVRRARDVVVVLNDARRVSRVTGRTVGEILKEIQIDSKGAYLHPSAESVITTSGEEIVVVQPVEVTLVHDGISQAVVTNELTAGALLRRLGVTLGPADRVEPSIIVYPAAGSAIKVVRVKEIVEKVQSKIAFNRGTEKTELLDLGIQKIKSSGVEGIRTKSYRVLYEDGKARQRTLLKNEVTKPPVDEVTLIGTRRPVLKAATRDQSGKASWYSIAGLTAAHRTLPFGTIVRVTNLANGKQVTVTIRDRGPYADGRIIDLSDNAFKEIAALSTGVINVKIEW